MASNHNPNWPREDWERYYAGTVICPEKLGPCNFIELTVHEEKHCAVLKSCATNKVHVVPLDDLKWADLRHPKLGWTMIFGIPFYVVKKPLRDIKKGLRHAILGYEPVEFVEDILSTLLKSKLYKSTWDKLFGMFKLGDLYSVPQLSLPAGVHYLATNPAELAVPLTREVLLVRHPEPTQQRAYVLCAGLSICGYVSQDGDVEQTGDTDVGYLLYAPES
jgi:hypothetical protein